ncbi:MAG: glycosyltransferase family A protein [Myxococcota bacterium]|nr:glycosyltransferase family A protein [Myxococcota bacterium]
MIVNADAETTAEPAVDVIMTVYNGETYLAEAVKSVLSQTLIDFALTIVDDGSDDDTPAILEKAGEDPRVRVIRVGRIGRARALNVAWKSGSAPYVANLDADDRAEPRRLERQLEYLRSHPEIGLLGTAARLEYEEGDEDQVRLPELENTAIRRVLLRRNAFVHSSVMMPRRVLEAVGGYNESYRRTVDHEIGVRIAARYAVANLPGLLTIKRLTPTQYFRTRIHWPDRYRTQAKIRWMAWWKLSKHPRDLRYVILSVVAMIGEWFRSHRPRVEGPTPFRAGSG